MLLNRSSINNSQSNKGQNNESNGTQVYPQYGFAQHKGYGTKMHMQAIRAIWNMTTS